MDRERSEEMLNARLDGELTPEEEAELQAYLADHPSETHDVLDALDRSLRDAFRPQREAAAQVAARTINALGVRRTPLRARVVLTVGLAAAAGFLLAMLLFYEGKETPTSPGVRMAGIANLTLATGPVEIKAKGAQEWKRMAVGDWLEAGTDVRSGEAVRCEFVSTDKSEVRLNEKTRARFDGARSLSLSEGELWSRVQAGDTSFTVQVPGGSVTALGTRFNLRSDGESTVVTGIDGRTRVRGREGEQVLDAAERVEIKNGTVGRKRRVRDLALSTRWINEILMLKGRDDPELRDKVHDVLALIGQTKMEHLLEEEIRSFGDHCTLPLAHYVQSDESRGKTYQRHKAARILADLAPHWAIPELIHLLQDDDGEVRGYAARGLERLTARDFGCSPRAWRETEGLPESLKQWREWWQKNRSRYPRPE